MPRTALSRRLVVLLFAACVPACSGEAETAPDAPEAEFSERPTLTGARYRLDWARGNARMVEGGGWEVTNDLGVTVRVTRGYLVNYTAALAPCPSTTSRWRPRSLLREVAEAVFLPRTAWASHGEELDPSGLDYQLVEDLAALRTVEYGARTFPGVAYCRVHYVAARATEGARGMPADVSMLGASLHLEGTWRRPGDAGATPFTIHSSVAYGALAEIADALTPPDTRGRYATVTFVRRVDTAFDGVDFAGMGAPVIERKVLHNVVQQTGVSVTLSPATTR